MPKKLHPVDEVFGIPIYFNPIQEKFRVEYKGEIYESDRLSDLKRKLELETPVELEEPVIYSSGVSEIVLTTITEISPHGYLRARERAGYGVSPNPDPKDLFPKTEHNMAVYKRHVSLRSQGWALIHQADALHSELQPYPKDYWKKKAKEIAIQQVKAE